MIFQPLILWTDALIYILVILALVFMIWAPKYEHLRLAWQHVSKQRTTLFALIVLLVYIIIGLLDSIHLEIMQHSTKTIKSLLDIVTGSLGTNDEKTYSAPFASHLYVKEIITQADGSQIRDYPVLRFAKMHILGTDKVGQDVFYQALKSVRTGLIIGTLTTLIMLPFAVIFGMLAGYFRGWVDDVIQYVYTTLSSIPDVLLIAAAILSLQVYFLNHPALFPTLLQRADMRLIMLCAILGITSWTYLCRLLRGETLKLREQDYVQAAIALGSNRSVILFKHILPNLMHLIVIAVVMDFSGLVLAEAVLTYVGVGVDPTTYSWGNMINAARFELAREPIVWWPLFAAFIFMFPLIISANLFADGVRDALDPKLRNN